MSQVTSSVSGRTFDTFPAAILVFIINDQEEFLMLSNPRSQGRWEVVNGAIDAGDSVYRSALRETEEEAGPQIITRPLGTIHAYTHFYDPQLPMISIAYLLAYEGGEVIPGDDMRGSEVGWFTLDELHSAAVDVLVPSQAWIFDRALDLYRLWHNAPEVELEKRPDQHGGIKYKK